MGIFQGVSHLANFGQNRMDSSNQTIFDHQTLGLRRVLGESGRVCVKFKQNNAIHKENFDGVRYSVQTQLGSG